MNKTININLGGSFFHIDENAFQKLNNYLNAIRRSIKDPASEDEILRDIEARIAELFAEKVNPLQQVITLKELDEVIAIMGQPEDYAIEDGDFEHSENNFQSSSSKNSKQLFRDPDNAVVSGVSSGLGHYFGFDPVWVRLLWVILTIFSSGSFIIVYILFWILVPKALTTSDKLKMKGEAVTISNIEKKIKETYEEVSDKIKNVDYEGYNQKIKKESKTLGSGLSEVIKTILKIIVKIIGVFIIFISGITLISLFISLFIAGISSFIPWNIAPAISLFPGIDLSFTPIWLLSLLIFMAVGIPFFLLFKLGLRMLSSNVKTFSSVALIALLTLWLSSVIALAIISLNEKSKTATLAQVSKVEMLDIAKNDTLYLAMKSNIAFEKEVRRSRGQELKIDQNNEEVLYSNNIRLIVRSTTDSIASLYSTKKARGSNHFDAKNHAERIAHAHHFENINLYLNGYFTAPAEDKNKDQYVELVLYLPEGSYLNASKNTYSFHRNTRNYRDILKNGQEGHYLLIEENETQCETCDLD